MMGCTYLILGVILVYLSVQVPEIEDISNETILNKLTFLKKNPDTMVVLDILQLQKLVCKLSTSKPSSETPAPLETVCDRITNKISKNNSKDNTFILNSLRIFSLFIGSALCFFSFIKFVELVPQQIHLTHRAKTLTLKHIKKR